MQILPAAAAEPDSASLSSRPVRPRMTHLPSPFGTDHRADFSAEITQDTSFMSSHSFGFFNVRKLDLECQYLFTLCDAGHPDEFNLCRNPNIRQWKQGLTS